MPSPAGVPVKLDRKRVFRFTWRTLVKLEQETGLTSTEVYARISAGSLSTINAAIWAGLLHADPDLTQDDVLDMVDAKRLREVAEALSEALVQAMPKAEEGEAPEGGAEKKGSVKD